MCTCCLLQEEGKEGSCCGKKRERREDVMCTCCLSQEEKQSLGKM